MSDDLSGRQLGRYHMLERLGRGGMAEVYRAYQPSLDRYVAIKLIYPHLAADEALRERFEREARAVAALRHPNIVQMYDFDVEAGKAFMAMEFIAGPTLKAAVQSLHRRGMLPPPPQVGSIVGQIADALAYAHEQGLVHRDVKPANVLLRRRGPADAPLDDAAVDGLLRDLGPNDVVLTDFGVARILKDSVEHTAAGTILGSPAYMAPEQGRGERADRRSDIYSLGVVLFELLTGQVPFDADTPFAIVLKHTTAPLPPPRAFRPDLPEGLERVLLKALAKDPADRYQDAAAFGDAVRQETARWQRGVAPMVSSARPAPVFYDERATRVVELTTALPPSPAPMTSEPAAAPPAVPARPRRRWGRFLLGCVGLLALIAVITLAAFLAGGVAVVQGLTGVGALVMPTQFQAGATAFAATVIADGGTPPQIFNTATLPLSPTALPAPVATAIAQAQAACAPAACPDGGADLALRTLDAALSAEPGQPELLAARAMVMITADPWTYREQIEADIAAALQANPALAQAELARGRFLAAVGDENSYDEALEALNRAVALAPGDPAIRYARAALLAQSPDYYEPDSPLRAQIRSDLDQVLAADPANIDALLLRGVLFYDSNLPNEALADFSAVLERDPTNRAALLRRGDLYRYYLADPQAAHADYSSVLAAAPDDTDALAARASLAIEQAAFADALGDLQALDRLEPANLDPALLSGFVYLALEEPQNALAAFERVLLLDPEVVAARYGRGLAALNSGAAPAALDDLRVAAEEPEALSDVLRLFYESRPQVFLDLAQAYAQTGRPAEAVDALDAAIEIDEDWFRPYLLRARLLREQGATEAARSDLRRALELVTNPDERAAVEAELRALP